MFASKYLDCRVSTVWMESLVVYLGGVYPKVSFLSPSMPFFFLKTFSCGVIIGTAKTFGTLALRIKRCTFKS